jgi:metallophosphoesterase (TIGR00282 family)
MTDSAQPLRILFIGDVIGPTGRAAIRELVPALRRDLRLDAVVANGENSADNGFGATAATAEELLSVVDFLTLGDHAFDQPDIGPFLDRDPRIIRPANLEGKTEGRGWGTLDVRGVRIGVVNLLGKVFMRPPAANPYDAADRAVEALRADAVGPILVDLQAEATSEKQGMGLHLDGRVTAVLGTHTHTPTADLRILPGGTAFMSDVGMTGARDGIIGFRREGFLDRMRGLPVSGPPRPGEGPARLDAVLLTVDPASGRCLACERVTRETDGAAGVAV